MERTTAQLQTLKRAIMSAGIPDDDDDYEDPTPAGYEVAPEKWSS